MPLTGPDAKKFYDILSNSNVHTDLKPYLLRNSDNYAACLIEIAEKMHKNNESPLQDYDGPVYLRASEAELKLTK